MTRRTQLDKLPWVYIFVAAVSFFSASSLGQVLPGSQKSNLFSSEFRSSPLPVNEAVPFHFSITNEKTVVVTWNIEEGYYLYRNQFQFFLKAPASSEISSALIHELPNGVDTHDEFFGDVEVYYGVLNAKIHLPAKIKRGEALIIEYQGCAEIGFCYTPQRVEISLSQ